MLQPAGRCLPKELPGAFHHAAKHIYKTLGDAANGVEQQFASANRCFAVVQAAIKAHGEFWKILHVYGKVTVKGLTVEVYPSAAGNGEILPLEIKITTFCNAVGDCAGAARSIKAGGFALELAVFVARLVKAL